MKNTVDMKSFIIILSILALGLNANAQGIIFSNASLNEALENILEYFSDEYSDQKRGA